MKIADKSFKNPDAILACRYFQEKNHVFSKYAMFNVQLTNTIESKDILCQRLIERENVWIQKLETLHPKSLNQELGS